MILVSLGYQDEQESDRADGRLYVDRGGGSSGRRARKRHRGAADVALLLGAIAGHDPLDQGGGATPLTRVAAP
jgi:hypothetical protein